MKAYSKEFEDVREAFEKTVRSRYSSIYIPDIKRAFKNNKISFYDNGTTDNLFQLFMQGYEYAKCLQRMKG